MSRHRIGDDGDRGLDDLSVARDLARQVGAGLDDQRLGVRGRLQNGQRNADQIVEVGAGGVDPVARAEHRGQHLFRAGLAVSPGDRDDRARCSVVAARGPGDRRRGACRPPRTGPVRGTGGGAAPHHRAFGAGGGGRRQIVVAVEPLALERHEQARPD